MNVTDRHMDERIDDNPYQPPAPWPPRSKVKIATSLD